MRRKTNIQSLNSTYQTNVSLPSLIFCHRKQCAVLEGCYRRGQLPIIVIRSPSTHHSHKITKNTGIILMLIHNAVQVLGLLTSTPSGALLGKFNNLYENNSHSLTPNSYTGAVPNFISNQGSQTRQMEGDFLFKMRWTCLGKSNSHSCSNR